MIRLCDKHPKPHLYIFTGSAKKQWEESTMTIYEVDTTVVETILNYHPCPSSCLMQVLECQGGKDTLAMTRVATSAEHRRSRSRNSWKKTQQEINVDWVP